MPYVHENGLTVHYIGEPDVEKLSFKSKRGQVQNYNEIISTYSPSSKFEDAEFPPNATSVGGLDLFDTASNSYKNLSANGWDGTVEWMRAADYVNAKAEAMANLEGEPTPPEWEGATPAFFVDGLSRMDVGQGLVGDCWFVSALSEIVMEKELGEFAIPDDNKNNNDTGAYHVRLYHNGLFLDVVVDDFIPVIRLRYGIIQTLGAGIPLRNGQAELWAAIAEKAYAKLNGSYNNLAGNQPRYAFQALSGGIGEYINLVNDPIPPNLYEYLQNTLTKQAFVVVWTAGNKNKLEGMDLGIKYDHAYAVTALAVVDYLGSKVKLVRLRNPHAKNEFTGRWSDQNIDGPYKIPGLSKEWRYVSQAQKDALGLVVKNEGEFWIQVEDVLKFFYQVDICYWVSPSELTNPNGKASIQVFQGSWSSANNTAGGQYQIANNPQYIVDVGGVAGKDSALIIDLAYKSLNVKSAAPVMGISVYPVTDASLKAPLPASFFTHTRALPGPKEGKALVGGVLSNVVGYVVPAGRYLIVPYLYKQFQWGEITEGEFCLRTLTSKPQ